METGADLGFYPEGSVAGRLRPGPSRSGDLYTLESWQERVQVGEIHGSLLDDTTFARMANPDLTLDRSRTYSMATSEWGADTLREQGRRVESLNARGMLRDLTIAHVKRRGFLA